MNGDDLDRDQAGKLQTVLFPGLNFLVRLMKRMQSTGFPPSDPLFKLVSSAYEWAYRLSMDLHYRSCGRSYQAAASPTGHKADLTDGVIVKSEIRVKPHAVLPGVHVVEVWHDGRFLATIAGAEGPGVKIITKHAIQGKTMPDDGSGVNVLEVAIKSGGD
jgi:hypothetical protein